MAGEREEGRGNEAARAGANERRWGRGGQSDARAQGSGSRNKSMSDEIRGGRWLSQRGKEFPSVTVLRAVSQEQWFCPVGLAFLVTSIRVGYGKFPSLH